MLSVQEAADRLGVSRQRVWKWIQEGRVPATKVSRSWILPDDVQRPEPGKPGRK